MLKEMLKEWKEDGKKEFTLPEAAYLLGMHRVTLLRMDQRGEVPETKWRRKPQPHRVYTLADIRAIDKRRDDRLHVSGRVYIDEGSPNASAA